MCLQFGFVIFWQKDFGAKATHKMLVKLTPGLIGFSLGHLGVFFTINNLQAKTQNFHFINDAKKQFIFLQQSKLTKCPEHRDILQSISLRFRATNATTVRTNW